MSGKGDGKAVGRNVHVRGIVRVLIANVVEQMGVGKAVDPPVQRLKVDERGKSVGAFKFVDAFRGDFAGGFIRCGHSYRLIPCSFSLVFSMFSSGAGGGGAGVGIKAFSGTSRERGEKILSLA